MRVIVIHRSFNILGGAELYSFNVIRILASLGFSTKVYTLGMSSSISKLVFSDRIKFMLVKPLLRTGGIYDLIFDTYSLSRILKYERLDADMVINTKANEVPLEADVCVVHYPLGFTLYFWDRVPPGAGIDPKYVNSLSWKLYIQPFREWFYMFSDRNLRRCRIIVANSRWTAKLLEKLGGLDSMVIYPPIDPEYLRLRTGVSKENVVVTISRFDPSKGIEAVLYMAKDIPQAKFIVIGRVSDRTSYNYYKSIKMLREKLGLSNLYLFPNLSEEAKRSILSRAKVYFHPAVGEHFGISVLEALASGAIPIVNKFSGSCIDIVEGSGYGFCYNSYAEALEIIKDMLSKEEFEAFNAEMLGKVLSKFSFEEFSKRFAEVIYRITRGKT